MNQLISVSGKKLEEIKFSGIHTLLIFGVLIFVFRLIPVALRLLLETYVKSAV